MLILNSETESQTCEQTEQKIKAVELTATIDKNAYIPKFS